MAASISEAGRLGETLQAGNWDLFEALARVAMNVRPAAEAIRRRVADALAADEYVVRFIPTARGAVEAVRLLSQPAAPPRRNRDVDESMERGARLGSQQGEGLVRIAAEEVGREHTSAPDGGLDHRRGAAVVTLGPSAALIQAQVQSIREESTPRRSARIRLQVGRRLVWGADS